MLKRVAAIGSSTAVIGALLTGALGGSAAADSNCPTPSTSLEEAGTAADPYLISSKEDLQEFRDNDAVGRDYWSAPAYAQLTADIDMNGCEWSSTIGTDSGSDTDHYFGIFDGQGYSITGLDVDLGGSSGAGVFGEVDGATIRNVTFDGDVTGANNVGGFIGWAQNGTTISNVSVSGTVTGTDDVGGLIGELDGSASTISESSASGAVNGDDQVGGLVGNADGSQIIDSSATGVVTGDDQTGGLVGELDQSSAAVTGSWASGEIDGSGEHTGGLVGFSNGGSVESSYATGVVDTNEPSVGGLIGQTVGGSVIGSWASGAVSGTGGDGDRVGGLIGETDGTTVTSSYATGSVSGDSDTGGLVGNADGDISGSYATGSVTGTGSDAGGLVGEMSSSTTVSGSWATGSAQTSADYAAGLVAEANSGTISNSWASGTVTVTGPDGYAGGLTARTAGVVLRSFATGPVSATNDYVGGLVGDAEGATITDSYASGAVSGAEYIGGLVGQGWSSTQIQSSYSVGAVTGAARTGGLVGVVDSSTVASSYWNTETSGLSSSDGGTGKTTAEMQDVTTYAGWSIAQGFNSSLTWAICLNVNSGYPYLTWSYSSDPCITEVNYQFTFRLPDGTECGAIGPVGVVDGTIYILPGEDADCRTMEGALVGGWTIPVPEGYDSIGSPAMPFAPGQKVRVSDSQQFTVVPFEPLLSLTLDSNVMADEACEANEVEFVDEANREEYSWVPRGDIAMARLPMVAACQPPGYTLAGWNTASDGLGTMFEPGAGLPSEWATDKINRYRLFAIWSPA